MLKFPPIALMPLLALALVPLLGCGGGGDTTAPPGPVLVNLTSFQAAAVVIGQPDFTSNMSNQGGAAGANTFNDAEGVAAGSLFIADTFNNRVLGFNAPPASNNASADFVLGQPDFLTTSSVGAPTATKFHGPLGVAVSGGRLFMTSFFQSRVLIWNAIPAATGTPANLALGQPDLVTGGQNTTQTGLDLPLGVDVADGKIVVADGGNERVMIWTSIPAASGAPADLVLGKNDFVTNGVTAGQNGMNTCAGVWTDGTRVVVCDQGNNRVLIWNTFPTTNGQNADLVLGQAGFGTTAPGTGASGMSRPTGVDSNGTQLFVCDALNHRVLVWNTFPTTNGQPADVVLGQSDFAAIHVAANDTNQDGLAEATPDARTMSECAFIAVNGTQLIVSDALNHRVLIFNGN